MAGGGGHGRIEGTEGTEAGEDEEEGVVADIISNESPSPLTSCLVPSVSYLSLSLLSRASVFVCSAGKNGAKHTDSNEQQHTTRETGRNRNKTTKTETKQKFKQNI